MLTICALTKATHNISINVQVTQFKCGGFTVGIKFNHGFFDGAGVVQFMKAVAEIAQGLSQPTTKPIWFRESIDDPQQLSFTLSEAHALASSTNDFVSHAIDISVDQIDQLKNYFTKETGDKCSTFDILTAMVWQCRTRAISLEPPTDVTLVFPINMRRTLHELLPSDGGYYGNYIYTSVVKAPSKLVGNAPLAEIVNLIRDAKRRAFNKSATRWSHLEPVEIEITYLTLCVTDWTNTGFSGIDYGWGEPIGLVADLSNIEFPVGFCLLFNLCAPRRGVQIWTQCIFKEHLESFLDQLKLKME